MTTPILPGATLGVLGSGQLGRMFALSARSMGYRIATYSPDRNSPTGQIADIEAVGAYDDLDAVRAFARQVDVVTFEFENVLTETVDAVAEIVPVRPAGSVLHTTQHRLREKTFLAAHGIPHTPFRHITTREDLVAGLSDLGFPAVLKTAGFGYDGKGQWKIQSAEDVDQAWQDLGGQEGVLEAFVRFEREVSVVGARGVDGQFEHYGPVDNVHANHILDITTAPSTLPPAIAREAEYVTRAVFEALDVVGVMCVEFFITEDGRVLVNEMAPRPHNSGHWTIEGAVTSQFEQQVRAVCGLPLGSTARVAPAVALANLLGDVWPDGGHPNWIAALAAPDVKLHLYGKAQARPGRKMGHITALAATAEDAAAKVRDARAALQLPVGTALVSKPPTPRKPVRTIPPYPSGHRAGEGPGPEVVMSRQARDGMGWRYTGVSGWSTDRIFDTLRGLGIDTDLERFARQASEHRSADSLVNEWTSQIDNYDVWYDFPLIATEPLWKRLAGTPYDPPAAMEMVRNCYSQFVPEPDRAAIRPSTPSDSSPVRKVGRNDRCPCGSGKKYKHCHGR